MEQTDTLQLEARPLGTLSGGERQRVYLAMLLAQNPRYLFLDEPTTYLDIGGQLQLMNRLKKLKDKCTVAVLHDLPLALSYCDTLLVLENGRLMGMDSPEKLVNSGLIQKVFGVECAPLPDRHYYIKAKG
jgi:iron complex transport system ATP-binding protein